MASCTPQGTASPDAGHMARRRAQGCRLTDHILQDPRVDGGLDQPVKPQQANFVSDLS